MDNFISTDMQDLVKASHSLEDAIALVAFTPEDLGAYMLTSDDLDRSVDIPLESLFPFLEFPAESSCPSRPSYLSSNNYSSPLSSDEEAMPEVNSQIPEDEQVSLPFISNLPKDFLSGVQGGGIKKQIKQACVACRKKKQRYEWRRRGRRPRKLTMANESE
ncbi:hypothetical protein GUITHDRAFT_114362 [Guillardia theta CCMP2712]|uniref:Uncharacterized protein n=1 Tax=Guillardia theta (strain CCMP2712) TaxID=905079 RepID=L1IUW9_GUITC|nr:hypothetical protein GUITHDRAFT_114362 [Guillardia theta CCMP2712]EKX39635.1 hypothetical protein GUITHDRAFT_114362 [Guillardia theta CCMP2712]|eukprot:XP_005826615.1 hypothetical protein GUITHDRAFT_114362 [Guillardia theta CCMP2712]